MEWKVCEADSRLIELLDTVDEEGPQEIEHRGKVYVVSSMQRAEGKKNRLVEIITSGPSWDGLEADGIPGTMRDFKL